MQQCKRKQSVSVAAVVVNVDASGHRSGDGEDKRRMSPGHIAGMIYSICSLYESSTVILGARWTFPRVAAKFMQRTITIHADELLEHERNCCTFVAGTAATAAVDCCTYLSDSQPVDPRMADSFENRDRNGLESSCMAQVFGA